MHCSRTAACGSGPSAAVIARDSSAAHGTLSGIRVDEAIAAFGAAWNTADDAERLRLLTACCLPDAVFAAPQGQVTGIHALGASIGVLGSRNGRTGVRTWPERTSFSWPPTAASSCWCRST
jgi:hypothetical protein